MLAGLAEYRLLLFGTLLLLVLLIAPDGIAGGLARLLRRRRVAADPTPDTVGTLPAARAQFHALAVESLSIAFGGVKAVTGFAMRADPGKVTSLIGPNGAGKTTVLNLLGGFYRPDSGTIRLDNADMAGRPAHAIARAGVARTYQTSLLFGGMTVLENLAIASRRGRLGTPLATTGAASDPAAIEEARRLAGFVGYRGDLARRAADLPHVDRRLVEIARALATGPAVLLLDEPAAGLSAADKERLARLLRRVADAGIAVVLVEHDMSLVMGISDKVVVLDAGVGIAEGAPQAVQMDPAVRKAYLGEGAASRTMQSAGHAGPGADLLEVGRLGAGYGSGPVLRNVGLRVRQHEMVSVLGANGAGKSTLMRALAGLHRPIEGGISLQGEDMRDLPAHAVAARGMTLVPEGRQVFPELSVLDNIRLGGFRRRAPLGAEVEKMLERFPRLRERLHQRAGLLSGGEQQMLALARGLMSQPRLLLLDEPSLGLAPAVIDDLYAALDRLRSEHVTILLVDQMAGTRARALGPCLRDGGRGNRGVGQRGRDRGGRSTGARLPGNLVNKPESYNRPMATALPTHGRYRYSAITRRPDYDWPGGRRLAVYLGFNVEHFAFAAGLGAALVPGRPQPDVLNFSWRDYGNRVGVWRCIELFDALKLPVGAILNTAIYDYCPEVAAAMRAAPLRIHRARPHQLGGTGAAAARGGEKAHRRLHGPHAPGRRQGPARLVEPVDLGERKHPGHPAAGGLSLQPQLVPRRSAGPHEGGIGKPVDHPLPAGDQRHPGGDGAARGRGRVRRHDRGEFRRDDGAEQSPAARDGNRAAPLHRRPAVPAPLPAPRAEAHRDAPPRMDYYARRDRRPHGPSRAEKPGGAGVFCTVVTSGRSSALGVAGATP